MANYIKIDEVIAFVEARKAEYEVEIEKLTLDEAGLKKKLERGIQALKEKKQSTAIIAQELLKDKDRIFVLKGIILDLDMQLQIYRKMDGTELN